MERELLNIRDKNSGLKVPRKAGLFFYGEEGNPFLAPRCVFIIKNKLIVSDTAQNRIFIWNSMPSTLHQKADVILGQTNAFDTRRNGGTAADASTLLYPSGLWSDGNKLIVADSWNHRVLIWNSFPAHHGQPADIVIGQPDFHSNLPNTAGVGAPASAKTLYWPYGVCSNGKHLWIADTGNRRVLFYEDVPFRNYEAADSVLGKEDFEDQDYRPEHAVWPYSVKISAEGVLAITDTQYYRVLIWKKWEHAFNEPADIIIGQPDLGSNGQNQYHLKPGANTLNWCYDVCIHKDALWLADTGNSRVLYFRNIPEENNGPADDFFGTVNFETIGEHLEVGIKESERLYWPFSVSVSNSVLAVADTGNHRIIFYKV